MTLTQAAKELNDKVMEMRKIADTILHLSKATDYLAASDVEKKPITRVSLGSGDVIYTTTLPDTPEVNAKIALMNEAVGAVLVEAIAANHKMLEGMKEKL